MLTAGSVTVEDGVKQGGPNDYVPTRKVSVTLSFVYGEKDVGHDVLAAAANLADAMVNEKLGRATAERKFEGGYESKTPEKKEKRATKEVKAEDTNPPKVSGQLAGEVGLVSPAVAASLLTPPGGQPSQAPSILTPPAASATPPATAPVADANVVYPSHADLYAVIEYVMTVTHKGEPIRAIMTKYTSNLPLEKQNSSYVPPESREAAMNDLKALIVA